MKYWTMAAAALLSATVVAGQRAVTDAGEVVVLNEDGTWEYESGKSAHDLTIIPENEKAISRSDAQSFLVKSQRNPSAIWLDPKKWAFEKAGESEAMEYKFRLKNADLYGLVITEQIETGLEQLAEIALKNARGVAPDAKVIMQEYRTVNGRKVLAMQLAGTMQGIKFVYYGYYYSDASGSTQLVTYTASNLLSKYKGEAEMFLSGLVQAPQS